MTYNHKFIWILLFFSNFCLQNLQIYRIGIDFVRNVEDPIASNSINEQTTSSDKPSTTGSNGKYFKEAFQ